ncbi:MULTISPECIES: MFS transporter [Streptomyces]|uniref:MFS transporter n=1 Tax=Streptomyces rhizosphaericola TaxID=2564098 RepID=A0ABY2PBS2_9ACTN|nr:MULTISPECIES: MFS transporter [Streptomyces]MYT97435.1 MFS transporter [Streptomyces sp. SID8350]TGZ05858.1 MFS transporter [Streptomyces rhizosphaericola]SCK13945.1 Predicted arabinose efflux permease, MFS family [Streptomyces sp. AmelKG-D3]
MKRLYARWATFDTPARLLMVNQFAINLAFYMLMPYLADHLADGLGLAAWAVGLVLGVRNLSQQGMFLIGGTLADRYGCKPMILAGCALRTVAFVLLAVGQTLPSLVVASALTGLAGALFNPAVRAYLAADAGEERRVEAFAVFNVFYQAGILVGPLAGLALLAFDFTLVCFVSAAIFGVLAVLQGRALPARAPAGRPEGAAPRSVLADWRSIAADRPFLLFALAMSGSYVLAFQVYLALPLRAREVFGEQAGAVTALVFSVSALAALSGQLRLTAWAKRTLSGPRAIAGGLALMGMAFVPLVPAPTAGPTGRVAGAVALAGCAALLAWGGALLYPFEMDTVVRLSGDGLVATYYGAYNTVSGLVISCGNLLVGMVFDTGVGWLPWACLALTGLLCAASVLGLERSGHLRPAPVPAPA